MVKNGVAESAALDKVQEELSEMKIRVLQREKEITADASGDLIPAFTKEMIAIRIAEAERQAKLHYIRHRLDELSEADRLQAAKTNAENQLSEARNFLTSWKDALKQLNDIHLPPMQTAPATQP